MSEELLDEEFTLDDLDLDSIDDEIISDDMSALNENIEEPHIIMGTKEFQRVLNVAKIICAAVGKDISSRCIAIIPDKDSNLVHCAVTDFDAYVHIDVPMLNTEHILEESIFIPMDFMSKIFNALPGTTTFVKKDDIIKIKLIGGELDVKTMAVDSTKFYTLNDVDTSISNTTTSNLRNMVHSLSSAVTAAVSPVERRIYVTPSGCFVHSLWGIIKSVFSCSEAFDLKVKDIAVINTLLGGLDESITINKVNDGSGANIFKIKGGWFDFRFLVSNLQLNPDIINTLNDLSTTHSTVVDNKQLSQLTNISAGLSTSAGKLEFNYNPMGVAMNMQMKAGNCSEFIVSGSAKGLCEPISKPIVVNSRLLLSYIKAFSGLQTVNVGISDKGITITPSDNTDLRVGILSVNVD